MYRALVVFHRWLAIIIAVPLICVALSGAMLIFEGPAADANVVRVAPGTRVLSLDSLGERAIAAAGGGTVVSVGFGRHPDEAFGFGVAQDSSEQDLLVDPYTGAVLGPDPGASWTQVLLNRIHQFHSTLLAGAAGRVVVTYVTLGSLLLVLTGLVLWWREKLWRIRWSASWKRIVFDLHHALGVFAALVLLSIVGTGVWMGFAKQLNPLVLRLNRTPTSTAAPQQSAPAANAVPISLDSIVRSAHSAVPDAPVLLMLLAPQTPALVLLRYPEDHTPGGRSRVYVDRYRGTILRATSTRTAEAGTKILTLQRPLHTGDIFGAGSQVIWFLAAVILASQAVTGILMWWNGRASRRPRAALTA
jgi:uncharacterized iron-regulated membrane protein